MFKREPKTIYFRHFQKQGLRSVFATEDARIAGAILGKMVVRDVYWETAQKMFAEYGLKVAEVAPEDVPADLPENVARKTKRQLSLM